MFNTFTRRSQLVGKRFFAKLIPDNLWVALKDELSYERTAYQPETELQKYSSENSLQVEELPNSPKVRAKKVVKGHEVLFEFYARSNLHPYEQEHRQKEHKVKSETASFLDFSITIKKIGYTQSIMYECTCLDPELLIKNVMVCDGPEKDYRGPDFLRLTEELQHSLAEYLNSFGVDQGLKDFIELLSLDREQRLYMEWLENFKNFLQISAK